MIDRTVGKSFPDLPAEVREFIAQSMDAAGAADSEVEGGDTHLRGGSSGESSAAAPHITRRLWLFLVARAGVDHRRRWAELSGAEVQELAAQVTRCVFAVDGRGSYRDEFVTCGGVQLDEVRSDCHLRCAPLL